MRKTTYIDTDLNRTIFYDSIKTEIQDGEGDLHPCLIEYQYYKHQFNNSPIVIALKVTFDSGLNPMGYLEEDAINVLAFERRQLLFNLEMDLTFDSY